MKKHIYVLGGGGHGRVALDALMRNQESIEGIFDHALTRGSRVYGIEVLGDDSHLEGLNKSSVWLVNGLGANPSTKLRMNLYLKLKQQGFQFHSFQHPSMIAGQQVSFEEGSQVMAGAILQSGVTVKPNAVINTGARIDHDCTIGAHAFIAPAAVLCGDVVIEESAFIGAGAIILPGLRIGREAVVAAGSIVTKSIESGIFVKGNPASIFRGSRAGV